METKIVETNQVKHEIIAKLCERLEPLRYIYALWLEGSDANGTVDEYSDMDIWMDVADEHETEAIDATEEALQSVAPFDYKYIVNHSHPHIRQRVYHLADTSGYLMIDFCWQMHSRPRDSYCYYENSGIEAARVVFDKDNIIRYKPYDAAAFAGANAELIAEMQYRHTQLCRVRKYVYRNQYLEAFAYYNKYVLEPLIAMLRIKHTPAFTDYGLVHISQHIPQDEAARLARFAQVSSLDGILRKTDEAEVWFGELADGLAVQDFVYNVS